MAGSNSRGLVLLLITSGFFITGLLFDYMPMIIDEHIKRTIELATNEEILSFWSRPPVDVNSYYWLYEITNPDQFQLEGEKPQMRQLGPFHFISRIEKRIINISPNKFRISYNSTRWMRLNESYSANQLDVPITVANPIFASILEGTRVSGRQLDQQTRNVAYGSINKLAERYNESILARNVTARLVLLGRPMPIVDKLKRIAETFGLGSKLPDTSSSNGRYGYISLLNGSFSGPFEIYTGYRETARSLGDLISYKGKRRLNYYDGKCNRLQASAGELRPAPIEPGKRLEMFQPGFCRIVHLDPTGEHKLREGLALSYVISPDDFSSGNTNPDNRCFCVNSSGPTSASLPNDPLDDNHCSLEGVIDLGPCSYNAPLMVAPSTNQLDSRILNSLSSDFDPEMLNGEVQEIDMADDKSQILILKRVGVPIRADFTITLFMRLVRDPAFKETVNVPQASFVPLVTVRETVTIPPRLAQILINLESFISLTYHIKVVMYLSAVILLCWLSGHYYSQTAGPTSSSSSGSSGPRSGSGSGSGSGAGRDRRRSGAPPSAAERSRRATLSNSSGRGGSAGLGGGAGSAAGSGAPTQNDDQSAANERTRHSSSGQLRSSNLASIELGSPTGQVGQHGGGGAATNNKSSPLAAGLSKLVEAAAEGRRLETVDELVRPPVRRADAGDSLSSERANSADSSRSLPPSRHASRMASLSQASSELADPAAAAATAQQVAPASPPPGEPKTEQSLRRMKRGAPSPAPKARIFSKLDEELGARRNQVGASKQAGNSCLPPGESAQVVEAGETNLDSLGVPPSSTQGDSVESTCTNNMGAGSSSAASMIERPQRRRRRKNWFVNVYSGFVHMLHGLRNTINDAGQLEVGAENNFRDRQLELLAGKIDNWYSGQDGSSPADTNPPGEELAGETAPQASEEHAGGQSAPDQEQAGQSQPGGLATNGPEVRQGQPGGEQSAGGPNSAGAPSSAAEPSMSPAEGVPAAESEPQGGVPGQPQNDAQTSPSEGPQGVAPVAPPPQTRPVDEPAPGEPPPPDELPRRDATLSGAPQQAGAEAAGGAGNEAQASSSPAETSPSSASSPPPPPPLANATPELNSTERNGLKSAQEESTTKAAAAAATTETQGPNEATGAEVARANELAEEGPAEVDGDEMSEAEVRANQLDKATTLDRIEAALGGSLETVPADGVPAEGVPAEGVPAGTGQEPSGGGGNSSGGVGEAEQNESNKKGPAASFDSALNSDEGELSTSSSRDSRVTQVLAGANQSSGQGRQIGPRAASRGARDEGPSGQIDGSSSSSSSDGLAGGPDEINELGAGQPGQAATATSRRTKNSSPINRSAGEDEEDSAAKQKQAPEDASEALEEEKEKDSKLDSRNGIKNTENKEAPAAHEGLTAALPAGDNRAPAGNSHAPNGLANGDKTSPIDGGDEAPLADSRATSGPAQGEGQSPAASPSDRSGQNASAATNGLGTKLLTNKAGAPASASASAVAAAANAPHLMPYPNGGSSDGSGRPNGSTTTARQQALGAHQQPAAGRSAKLNANPPNANGPTDSNGLNGNNILNGKIISQRQQQQLRAGGTPKGSSLGQAGANRAPQGFNNQHTAGGPISVSREGPAVVVVAAAANHHHEQTAAAVAAGATTTGNHHQQQQQQEQQRTVQPAGA